MNASQAEEKVSDEVVVLATYVGYLLYGTLSEPTTNMEVDDKYRSKSIISGNIICSRSLAKQSIGFQST